MNIHSIFKVQQFAVHHALWCIAQHKSFFFLVKCWTHPFRATYRDPITHWSYEFTVIGLMVMTCRVYSCILLYLLLNMVPKQLYSHMLSRKLFCTKCNLQYIIIACKFSCNLHPRHNNYRKFFLQLQLIQFTDLSTAWHLFFFLSIHRLKNSPATKRWETVEVRAECNKEMRDCRGKSTILHTLSATASALWTPWLFGRNSWNNKIFRIRACIELHKIDVAFSEQRWNSSWTIVYIEHKNTHSQVHIDRHTMNSSTCIPNKRGDTEHIK